MVGFLVAQKLQYAKYYYSAQVWHKYHMYQLNEKDEDNSSE